MEELLFNVSERNEKGSKVRKIGEIPCIIYGEGLKESVSAKMTKNEMVRLLRCPKSSVVSLKLDNNIKRCIVKELQRDVFGKIVHIDFQSIRKGELVKLKIPVAFIGQELLESKGLLLETFMSEIELQGEVDNFPKDVEFDVSKINSPSQIFVRDLSIPEGIHLEVDGDMAIAKIGDNAYVEVPQESEE